MLSAPAWTISSGEWMTALTTKFLRESWKIRMQLVSIALVVAAGIMSVITMRGAYESLTFAQQDHYVKSRFADVWAPLVRAPESLRFRLEQIAGIETLDTRVRFLATLDLGHVGVPAQGMFVSIPETGRAALNDITLSAGRYVEPGKHDEVIISQKFAAARQLRPGDRFAAVLNGRSKSLMVVGIANSPEFSYTVPPGSLFPDDARYGVFWMGREALGAANNMDGAFNEVTAKLAPDADADAVLQQMDDLLDVYGGLGSYLREDQLSHLILDNELNEIRVMTTFLPTVFMSVAVFLLYLVLGRLIKTQRTEIAVLKAFGYSDREVGLHYLSFALLAVMLGGVLGTVGGIELGKGLMGEYARYFDIPNLDYRLSRKLLLLSVAVCLLGAVAGALAAVRRAVTLPPAEAMRPEAPPRFTPGPFERFGLGRLLASSGRMILRNIERKPFQISLSSFGVAMALAILIVGMSMVDSINWLMDLQFRVIQREDLMVTFKEDVGAEARYAVEHLPGVVAAEVFRSAPARLHAGHREDEISVTAMDHETRLRRIATDKGLSVPMPASGIVLSQRLAERLRVSNGDPVNIEWLVGSRQEAEVRVSGIIRDFMGVSAWMSRDQMKALTGDPDVISGAWLAVSDMENPALYEALQEIPLVAGVMSPDFMLQSFDQEMARSMLVSSMFLLGFASIIAVGIIYNNARISLSERGRELASLRVMGFHRSEVSRLLLGEQAVVTILALPLGAGIGYLLSWMIARNMGNDTFRIPLVISAQTYVSAILIIVIASLLSGMAVRRRLDRIDLIEVLKTRE
jgi:putative ABC transport system permease protein